jgi:hypothetical protein
VKLEGGDPGGKATVIWVLDEAVMGKFSEFNVIVGIIGGLTKF